MTTWVLACKSLNFYSKDEKVSQVSIWGFFLMALIGKVQVYEMSKGKKVNHDVISSLDVGTCDTICPSCVLRNTLVVLGRHVVHRKGHTHIASFCILNRKNNALHTAFVLFLEWIIDFRWHLNNVVIKWNEISYSFDWHTSGIECLLNH